MPIEVVTIPCLSDNYAFLVHSGEMTALVDAPEAAPVTKALNARGWSLDEIWITHHHNDHIEGVAALKAAFGARIVGAGADTHRLPELDHAAFEGETFQFAGHDVHVHDVSGHTVGHIAFHMPDAGAVFTGDSLMALGCGRLFEGTPGQMWASLSKLAALPDDTLVCSGHEYTAANARFAATIESDNQDLAARTRNIEAQRAKNEPTVPSTLGDEKATNPFLRAHLSSVKKAIGLPHASDIDAFAEIRARKDRF